MGHGIPSIPLRSSPADPSAAAAQPFGGPRASTIETLQLGGTNDDRLLSFLRGAGGGAETASGAVVTPESALRTATAYRCVTLISGAVATLPLDIKLRRGDRREDATDHPLWRVLRRKPNPWQTPSQFRRYMQSCVLLRKGGFARIVRSGKRVVALLPLNPDRVEVSQNPDLTLTFKYTQPGGGIVEIPQAEMFYLCGLSLDGIRSVSVLTYARETVGESLATARHAATMFRNGTSIGGVLSAKGKLSKDQQDLLRESLEAYRGADNAHKNLILQDEMSYQRLGLDMVDAQFIQNREFSQFEIAMFFGVPPHMLGLVQKSTSFGSGIEQMGEGFKAYTLQDWLTMWSEAIARDLVRDDEPDLYARFNTNALVRGDIKTRFGAYAIARQWGWMSANDVLEKEDENPIEGGDKYLDPLNMKGSTQDLGESAGGPTKAKPDAED